MHWCCRHSSSVQLSTSPTASVGTIKLTTSREVKTIRLRKGKNKRDEAGAEAERKKEKRDWGPAGELEKLERETDGARQSDEGQRDTNKDWNSRGFLFFLPLSVFQITT